MLIEIKPYLVWLHDNPAWAGVITFAVAFIECLALVGLLIPGTVTMTAIGTLVGTGILPFVPIMLWAMAGALAGDLISYGLGYHYRQGIRHIWPFSKCTNLLRKGEVFFLRHGGISIFLGRFIGPIRPILPVIAGMLSMPWRRFLICDGLSALAWAPVYMFPGILLGAASKELPPEMATRLILLVVFALLVLWCISWLLKHIYSEAMVMINHALSRLWKKIHERANLTFLKKLLMNPADPLGHNQLTLAILFLLALCIFVELTYSVYHRGILTGWNEPIYYFMRSLRSTAFDHIMVGISFVGARQMAIMWGGILIWLLVRRQWWAASHWFGIGVVCFVIGEAIKFLVHFPRPVGLVLSPNGYSFPSGHSLVGITFFGFLAVLLTTGRNYLWRYISYGAAALIIFSIGVSRIYLGAHWLTDVVGSLILGFCLVALFTVSYRRHRVNTLPAQGILVIVAFSLVIASYSLLTENYDRSVHNYTPLWTPQTVGAKHWWKQEAGNEPLYRSNRFGKEIQVFNVQWAGYLPAIEYTLSERGWTVLPKASFSLMINEFANEPRDLRLPILSQFYEDRKPVLVMYKLIEQPKKAVLVLRLWDAHLVLNNNESLWLGTINYHQPWRAPIFNRNKKDQFNQLPSPSDTLATDLQDFTWRKLTYSPLLVLPVGVDTQWDKNVLLVKPQ